MIFPEKVADVLITAEALQKRVGELGEAITKEFKDKDLTVVGILKGSALFTADLVRAIELPMVLDFMAISSYGGSRSSSPTGVVKILKDLDTDIEGRDVLVVEDIVDTGLTLNYLMKILRARNPSSISLCVLLDRTVRRIIQLQIDYRGFEIPDVYVVGYGLDHKQYYRNLSFIGTLKEERE
jgi:hypoxanthine phosphoribosyltransferase